jgi:hypothetical protein
VGYYVIDEFGNRDLYRHFSVTAETGPNPGNWVWNRPEGTYSGPITCVAQSGSDVWLAGPVTHSGPLAFPAIFALIHDGGSPGKDGDSAFVWGADPGQLLEEMEAACESMADPAIFDDAFLFQVVTGNATVH